MIKQIILGLLFVTLTSSAANVYAGGEGRTKKEILQDLVSRLDPERSANDKMNVGFIFSGSNGVFQINILFGKAEFIEGKISDPDLLFILSESAWRKILAGEVSIWEAVVSAPDEASQVTVQGKTDDFERFLTLFNKDPNSPVRRFT